MRGKSIKKREKQPDIKYGSILVNQFINYIMLDGKKDRAKKIVYEYMDDLAKETKLKPVEAFEQVLDNLKPKVEVKSRRVGGANYQVPVPVPDYRQVSLAMRWLIQAARDGRKNQTFSKSLLEESVAAFKKEGTAFKKKEDTHRMAEANKAFSHLSW